ncbi:hypothetical protein ACVI1L_004438 [Bradyrhizobium sp. USDA 4516]
MVQLLAEKARTAEPPTLTAIERVAMERQKVQLHARRRVQLKALKKQVRGMLRRTT